MRGLKRGAGMVSQRPHVRVDGACSGSTALSASGCTDEEKKTRRTYANVSTELTRGWIKFHYRPANNLQMLMCWPVTMNSTWRHGNSQLMNNTVKQTEKYYSIIHQLVFVFWEQRSRDAGCRRQKCGFCEQFDSQTIRRRKRGEENNTEAS